MNWSLTVLSRSVRYKNLSRASQHVGLSQPQLSRIVARLEEDLDVVLLDRHSNKKQSSWTKTAFDLAQLYSDHSDKWQIAIDSLIKRNDPKSIRIGTLEGLSGYGQELCDKLFLQKQLSRIELHIYDIKELEESFDQNNLEAMLSVNISRKTKPIHIKTVGYQPRLLVNPKSSRYILSPFEYNKIDNKDSMKEVFVSNSLAIRRSWIDKYQGKAWDHASISKSPTKKDHSTVFLVGQDNIHPKLWRGLTQATAEL